MATNVRKELPRGKYPPSTLGPAVCRTEVPLQLSREAGNDSVSETTGSPQAATAAETWLTGQRTCGARGRTEKRGSRLGTDCKRTEKRGGTK